MFAPPPSLSLYLPLPSRPRSALPSRARVQYMSSYIEVWSDVPAKPTFADKVLQAEWEFVRPAPPAR